MGSQVELPLNTAGAQNSKGMHFGELGLPWPLLLCLLSAKLKMESTAEHCGASQSPPISRDIHRDFLCQRDISGCRPGWTKHPSAGLHLTTMQRGREPELRAGPILAQPLQVGPAHVSLGCQGWRVHWASRFAIPTVSVGGNWRSCFLEIAGVIWRTAQES